MQSSAVPLSSIPFWRSQSYGFDTFGKFIVCLNGKIQKIYNQQSILSGQRMISNCFHSRNIFHCPSLVLWSTFVAETAGQGFAISQMQLACWHAGFPFTTGFPCASTATKWPKKWAKHSKTSASCNQFPPIPNTKSRNQTANQTAPRKAIPPQCLPPPLKHEDLIIEYHRYEPL